MANRDSAKGFRWAYDLNGGAPSVRQYVTAVGDGAVLGKGDPVELTGTADTISRAETGDNIYGISLSFGAASAITNHDVIHALQGSVYDIQEDSVGGALAANDEQLNSDFIVANASTTTGLSLVELDSNTAAATNTLDLKILQLAPYSDNAQGNNANWYVQLNKIWFANQIVGVA